MTQGRPPLYQTAKLAQEKSLSRGEVRVTKQDEERRTATLPNSQTENKGKAPGPHKAGSRTDRVLTPTLVQKDVPAEEDNDEPECNIVPDSSGVYGTLASPRVPQPAEVQAGTVRLPEAERGLQDKEARSPEKAQSNVVLGMVEQKSPRNRASLAITQTNLRISPSVNHKGLLACNITPFTEVY